MYKRKTLIGVFVIIFMLSVTLILVTTKKYYLRKTARLQLQVFNRFPIVTLDSTSFDYNDLAKRGYTIVVYYNGECRQCVSQVTELVNNIDKIWNSSVLFISNELINEIKEFSLRHDLISDDRVFFSKMNEADVFSTFGSFVTPQIFVYNKSGELIIEFRTPVNIETIKSYLH